MDERTESRAFLYRSNKYPPLTDEQRARMATDYSDEAVKRWGLRLLESRPEAEALAFARESRKGYWAGTEGDLFWSRVEAWIALREPKDTPELEELPAPDDLSDGAVLRWSRALVAKYGEDEAITKAKAFQALYTPGTAHAALWSRVLVQLLVSPRAGAVVHVGVDMARGPDVTVEVVKCPAYARNVSSAATPEAIAAGLPHPRWFEERGLVVAPVAQPKPTTPAASSEPEQGRLF